MDEQERKFREEYAKKRAEEIAHSYDPVCQKAMIEKEEHQKREEGIFRETIRFIEVFIGLAFLFVLTARDASTFNLEVLYGMVIGVFLLTWVAVDIYRKRKGYKSILANISTVLKFVIIILILVLWLCVHMYTRHYIV